MESMMLPRLSVATASSVFVMIAALKISSFRPASARDHAKEFMCSV